MALQKPGGGGEDESESEDGEGGAAVESLAELRKSLLAERAARRAADARVAKLEAELRQLRRRPATQATLQSMPASVKEMASRLNSARCVLPLLQETLTM